MNKCNLPFIFQRSMVYSPNKTTEHFQLKKSIELFHGNYGNESNRRGGPWSNANANAVKASLDNDKLMRDTKAQAKMKSHYWTINILIPSKLKYKHQGSKRNISQCSINKDNSTFITKCYIKGKEDITTEDQLREFNMSLNTEVKKGSNEIGLLLKQLEINKEKIDNEREDLAKMIDSTKKTQEKISRLTQHSFRFNKKINSRRINLNKNNVYTHHIK